MLLFRHMALTTLMCATLSAGCATFSQVNTVPATAPTDWQLSEDAQRTYYFLLLDESVRAQDDATASHAISRLLELDQSPQVFLAAAGYYRMRGEAAFARPILQKGLTLYPDNLDLVLALVEAYLQENRPDDALAVLNEFVTEHPDNHEARQILSLYLLDAKQYAKAVDAMRAVPADKRNAHSYYYYAKALIGLNKYDEAEAALKKALELRPETFVEAWAELAYLYELKKDYPAAEELYSRILTLGEAGPEIWLRLVALNLKLNHPQKALEYTRQGPDQLSFLLESGTLFLEEGFYDEADEILTPLKDRPGRPDEIWFYLAVLAVEGRNDIEKGLDLLANIPPSNRFYDRSMRLRASLLLEAGNTKEAKEIIAEGKERFPTAREFWLLDASAAMHEKDYQQAEAILKDALVNWPGDVDLLFALASLYDTAGRKKDAYNLMEEVILADSDHYQALNYVGYTLADEGRDLQRALLLIENAIKLSPGSAYILDSLAWVHFKLGNTEQAVKHIEQAVATQGGDDATIWEHYGDIALKAGNKNKAIKAYRKAIKLGAKNPDVLKSKIEKAQ
ncbi:tetratricopeptide repeat protein [Oleidesulfovibrio sp.]|uniref:tetratricopeptide repeat protein n=1 Tax=Oleidesulfovibrio sp. TaxID=2909707 RepID=UPI003A8B0514